MNSKQNQIPSIDWAETHFVVVQTILDWDATSPVINKIRRDKGRFGLMAYSFRLTNHFMDVHAKTIWDGDWEDAVVDFVKQNIGK
jgi:hypothetical protein